ncbi:MAG: glycosyltransferase family 39 protein, partial [Chloroflexi bacterium]|nr:glycosyltransferase family 39 protein [Chloroflexota bacterium]
MLMLAGALAVGAFLRFYQLDTLPPGLWHDEAFNGIDAQRILAGEFPIMFEANHGRQPLFIYLQAIAVALIGPTPEALRSTSALVGVLTIASVYFLARTLEAEAQRGRRAGLLAAGLLAVMPWHVHLSRYGLRAILFPLLICWFLFFLWRALGGGRWREYGAAGVALAGAFYSYTAAVLLPPLAVALALLRLIQRPRLTRLAAGTAVTLGVALILVAPLLLFYLQHLDLAFSRPAEISLLNPARAPDGLLRAGGENLGAAVGMFFWAGSTNWRHNLAGWPLLDPLSGALLLAGAGLAFARWRRPDAQLLLLAAGTLLLPTVLFPEGLPHATRALGMAPVVAVLSARGALAAAGRLHLLPHNLFGPVWLILLLVVGSATFYRYFVLWASKPEVYFAHEADVRAAAEALPELASRVPDLRAVWAAVPSSDQVVSLRFLAPEIADRVGAVGHQNELGPVAPALLPLLYVVPASQRFVPPDLDAVLGIQPLLGPPAPQGEPAFRAFLLDGAPMPAPTYSPGLQLDARLGQAVELRGASITAGSDDERAVLVSLLWRPLADLGPEARLFFHLLDGSGRIRGQAHFSARPQYPWDPGGLASGGLVSWFLVPLDVAAPPGTYRVAVGLSATLGGAALAADARSASLLANRVLLGTIPFGPRLAPPSSRSLALQPALKEIVPGLQLMGYRLDRRAALPGDAVDLALYWRALRPGLLDYRVAAWAATSSSPL